MTFSFVRLLRLESLPHEGARIVIVQRCSYVMQSTFKLRVRCSFGWARNN